MLPSRHVATMMIALAVSAVATNSSTATGLNAAGTFATALESARSDSDIREQLHVALDGQLADNLQRLDIFGRGVGIWNREAQFSLDAGQVGEVLELLHDADFANIPERLEPEATNDRQKPVRLIRAITVRVGGEEKTVVQDNKSPTSRPLKQLTDRLVALCREPAANGVGAASLEDGLRKVADGTLARETLQVTANAPQIRSLATQNGQGWLLSIRHGVLKIQSHNLATGYRTVLERPLTDGEARRLGRALLEAGTAELPQNINTAGHTQLTVAVLQHDIRCVARSFATTKDAEAERAAERFDTVRESILELSKTAVGGVSRGDTSDPDPIE
jgi:hypothetical protein